MCLECFMFSMCCSPSCVVILYQFYLIYSRLFILILWFISVSFDCDCIGRCLLRYVHVYLYFWLNYHGLFSFWCYCGLWILRIMHISTSFDNTAIFNPFSVFFPIALCLEYRLVCYFYLTCVIKIVLVIDDLAV